MPVEFAHFEQRLSSLEAALNLVQKKLGMEPAPSDWVEQVSGSLADIPEDDYNRFLDYCRAARNGGSLSEAENPRP